jgi:hypothetical protein
MSVVFTDNFTVSSDTDLNAYPSGSADYAMSIGTASNLQVEADSDNVLARSTSETLVARIIDASMPTGDQQISATCGYSASWNSGEIFVRMATSPNYGNFYSLKLETWSAVDDIKLYRADDGVYTLLDTDSSGLSTPGTATLTLKAEGTYPVELTGTVNGVTVSYSDSTGDRKTAGPPGIGIWTESTSGASVDNVSVDNLVVLTALTAAVGSSNAANWSDAVAKTLEILELTALTAAVADSNESNWDDAVGAAAEVPYSQPQSIAQLHYYVDWTGAGTFAGAYDDITADVISDSFKLGRDYASELVGRSIAGACQILLHNFDGRYNSFLTTSPIYGQILPGRKVRVIAYGSGGYVINGHVVGAVDGINKTFTISPTPITRSVTVYVGGYYKVLGVDYTISGSTITFTAVPTDRVTVSYRVANDNGHYENETPSGAINGVNKDFVVENLPINSSCVQVFVNDSLVIPASVSGSTITLTDAPTAGQTVRVCYRTTTDSTFVDQDTLSPATDGTTKDFFLATAPDPGSLKVYRAGRLQEEDNVTNNRVMHSGQVIQFQTAPGAGEIIVAYYRVGGVSCGKVNLWTGYLDSVEPQPDKGGGHSAALKASGPLSRLVSITISPEAQANYVTGEALAASLTAAGWTGGSHIDVGQITMPIWWVPSSTQALTAMRDIEETELGFILEGKDGLIIFEDSIHRDSPPHNSIQTTFSDAVSGALHYFYIKQGDLFRHIYNQADMEVSVFTTPVSDSVIWTLGEVPSIAAYGYRKFIAQVAQQRDARGLWMETTPVAEWSNLVAGVDYIANSQADGLGVDRTANVALATVEGSTTREIIATNNYSAAVYLTKLQSKGKTATVSNPVKITASDAESKAKYGFRLYPSPSRYYADTAAAQARCNAIVAKFKNPRPILTISIYGNRDKVTEKALLGLNISDRVIIVANNSTLLGINQQFFIESIEVRNNGKFDQVIVYQCSPTTAPASAASGRWADEVRVA